MKYHGTTLAGRILFIAATALVLLTAQGLKAKETATVSLETTSTEYHRSTPVKFTLRNTGSSAISLPNSAPWHIEHLPDQRTVFAPTALQVITTLEPGQSKSWTWDQKNNKGKSVPPGQYRVVFKSLNVDAKFTILPK